MIAADVDGLAHMFSDLAIDDALLKLALDHKTFVIPTLSVMRSVAGNQTNRALLLDEDLKFYLLPSDSQSIEGSFTRAPNSKIDYAVAREGVLLAGQCHNGDHAAMCARVSVQAPQESGELSRRPWDGRLPGAPHIA